MRLPIRKPGKYTHLKPDQYLTEEKFYELKNKLERLKNIRPRLAEEVKKYASDGDFSENAAYQIAKGRLRGVNRGILEIEDHLKSAIIIKHVNRAGAARLGSKVTVETAGKQKSFLILGSSETNPAQGVISRHSPLGSALIGRGVGDKVKLPGKEVEYKILKIE
ncbi:MAG: GreA/GreB family elongation factor [bacterium]|nr:GreA/GreB family elongation factor [bacterium]